MTAFVRRYSRRIAAMICVVKGHDFTRWATKPGQPLDVATDHRRAAFPYGERKCRRCGATEVGAAPKKRTRRASNAADTIQRGLIYMTPYFPTNGSDIAVYALDSLG